MKNEKLYALMVVCILILAYSISLKFNKKATSKTVKQMTTQKIITNDPASKKNNTNEDAVFNTKALNSPEFLNALNKIQGSQKERPNSENPENLKYTQAEFEQKLGEYLLKPKEEFEKWADENTDFFLKYKHVVVKKLNEVYKIDDLSVSDALGINVAMLKVNSDNKQNPEVIDYFIDLANTKDKNYAIVNLKESAFYSLSAMSFERDEVKLESCIRFLDQIEDVRLVQKMAPIFKNMNPTLSARFHNALETRLENANKK